MKHNLAGYLDNVISLILLGVAAVTPLIVFNQTTEFFDTPKMIFLIVATLVLLGLWIFSWIVKGKVVITRTPLDIPLLLLLGVVLISTFFSTARYASIYGNFPSVHGSAVSWVVYILLYFVTVSHLKSWNQIKMFLYALYGSGVILSLISLMSFFHAFLPIALAQAVNFTTTGSSFSTIALLLLLLPLPLLSLLNPNKYLPVPASIALASLFGVTIVLIGSPAIYIALLIAVALTLFVAKADRVKQNVMFFAIPIGLMGLALILAYLPLPANKLQQMEANFPKEIQLPFDISWKVSASAFRDSFFIGTGPSTYLFNFTTYKPAEFNTKNFWSFSFDTAYNEFLQTLGTLGFLGFGALVLLCLVIFTSSWKNLALGTAESHQDVSHIVSPALAISGLLTLVLFAIHATTLVSITATFFVLAALMMSQKGVREKVMEFSMGIKASTSDNKQFDLFPIILFVVFLVASAPVLFRMYTMVAADYYHRQALVQASKNGTLTYTYLQKAENLNNNVDLYRVDMAQTNFALANAIAAQKGPTKDNPQGTLTAQDKQTIQTLLSQSINEGRAAVVLNPRSARNWAVLASIYNNITGVAQNAAAFSLDSYSNAIQRDPLNPVLRLNVGGIYYAAKNYDLAIRFFTDAANLKPDYANAYFNLAIALRDKGDLQNAIAVAQQLQTVLKDPSTPDYKTATQLVDELKAKVAAGTPATTQPTANGQPSALQNPISNVDVKNVTNTNPPSVTPVPSIKPNPNANIPQVTAAPTKTP